MILKARIDALLERKRLLDREQDYLRRIESEKGLETVFRALTELPEQMIFYIIGAGGAESALRDRARDLGIAERICWQPPVAPDALPIHMNAMDALVLPSQPVPLFRLQFVQ